MSEANEADRERAQVSWETPYGNNRREGNVPYSFDQAFAAHRLAAAQAERAGIVKFIRDRAETWKNDDVLPDYWYQASIIARRLADEIELLNKGSST